LSYSIEKDVDYGYGKIDAMWHISLHPSLPTSKLDLLKFNHHKMEGKKQQQTKTGKIINILLEGLKKQ
jgi:hypothetical protein